MRMRTCCCVALATLLCPGQLFAQDQPLSELLVNLLVRAVSMPSTTQTVPGNPHEAHFLPSLAQTQAPFEINRALVGQLGTFPIGSSSGGFSFNFDPSSGLFNRASRSFGPGFAERALTNGRGRFGFGLNYQRLEFSSFEGVDLHGANASSNIGFILQHNDCCPGQTLAGAPGGNGDPKNPFFEGDLVAISLSLRLKTDVFAPFVNYGISQRWDVGAAVPIVRIQLDPIITSTIDRISTASNQLIHSFDGNGQSTQVVTSSASAAGVGDIVLRTKYRFVDASHGGLAAGVDLRLPTGDKENLLGTGARQVKLSVIASTEFSRVAPHVNLGYTLSRGDLSSALTTLSIPSGLPGSATSYQNIFPNGVPARSAALRLPNEINYAGGIDIVAHPLVTLSADLIGRSLLNSQRFGTTTQSFTYRTEPNGPLLPPVTRNALDILGRGTLNLLLGVVGAKVNIPGTPLLLTGSVLFPLTNAGLRPNVTPVVGLDYSFKK